MRCQGRMVTFDDYPQSTKLNELLCYSKETFYVLYVKCFLITQCKCEYFQSNLSVDLFVLYDEVDSLLYTFCF